MTFVHNLKMRGFGTYSGKKKYEKDKTRIKTLSDSEMIRKNF